MPSSFAVPTRFIFKSAFLRNVVLTTTETWLFRLGRFSLMWWLYVVYLTIYGCIPERVGLLFSHFHCQRNFHCRFPCETFSAKSLLWVCLLLRPQTNRSRRASSKNVPNAQCSEHFFRAALYSATPSPSCCSRLWK